MESIKKSSKFKNILIAVGVSFVLICICLFVAVIASPTPTSTPVAEPQSDLNEELSSVDVEVEVEEIETEIPEIASTATLIPEPIETNTPIPSPTPIQGLVRIGTHLVGKDIQSGIYWGQTGVGVFDSCYWTRVSDLSGEMGAIISNDNSIGQYYVEIKDTDFAFETACDVTLLEYAPVIEFGNELPPGTYLIGRDIKPGMYQGQAGTDILDSCYWARLSGVSGEMNALIANDNAAGSFYVQVAASDFALKTNCPLVWISE